MSLGDCLTGGGCQPKELAMLDAVLLEVGHALDRDRDSRAILPLD
jgi:hypothetical protein